MKALVLACCLLASMLPCGWADDGISAEARECFEWFQTLGYPDVKDAPWAEIGTGSYLKGADDVPHPLNATGFIIHTEGDEFKVLCGDLTAGHLVKSPAGLAAYRQIGYTEKPFHDEAVAELKFLRKRDPSLYLELPRTSPGIGGGRLPPKSRIFFLAYVCWRKGELPLAQALFEEAKPLLTPHYLWEKPEPPRIKGMPRPSYMRGDLERELGIHALWQAMAEMGGGNLGWDDDALQNSPLVPRSQLLTEFREIVRLYPASPSFEQAKKTCDMLERMAREEEGHPAITDEMLSKLPVRFQVKEWIFRLRDQNGHMNGQPGSCEVFSTDQSSPAHQLLKIGYDAVPQLIEALDDDRLSRSVGFDRDFFFSHQALTVGDCAAAILSRLSGGVFHISPAFSNEGAVAKAKQTASAWWEEFHKKGEHQYLLDAIASGDVPCRELVDKLRKQHPEEVDAVVLAGAAKVKRRAMADDFIFCLSQMPSAAAGNEMRRLIYEMSTFRR